MDIQKRFKEISNDGKEFRSVPLWAWNDDLQSEELKRQIWEMKKAGLGGYFIHAREGLITPYLDRQWMDCVRTCIKESKDAGISTWLYDEYCWPSGTANGKVPKKSIRYQQKILCLEETSPLDFELKETTLAIFVGKKSGKSFQGLNRVFKKPSPVLEKDTTIIHFFYQNNDAYIDVLSKEAVYEFIKSTYELYYQEVGEEFAKMIPGIFTDEAHYRFTRVTDPGNLARLVPKEVYFGLPWSLGLPTYFKKKKGYDLIETLPSLFYKVGNFNQVRYDFWNVVTILFVESFSEQIGKWCKDHHLELTGHFKGEESLVSQIRNIGAVMPHYQFMHIPGVDHLCREIAEPSTPKQVSSVAHQLGKERVLSETFGCTGWNVNFEELKWILEWQFVLGVNFCCPHQGLYSLKGSRKRDYPPSLYYQEPWWHYYKIFNDYTARLSFILTQGEHVADILVLHPIESAWAIYDPLDESQVNKLNTEFITLSKNLLKIHYDYDYGDEEIIEKYGKVLKGRFIVGNVSYKIVILPSLISIREKTLTLLEDFISSGGKIIIINSFPIMVEGVPSNRPKEILSKSSLLPNEEIALKQILKGVLPSRIKIVDSEGGDIKEVYYQQRNVENKQVFFLVNISRNKTFDSLLKIRGKGTLEKWSLETGNSEKLPCQLKEGYTISSLIFLPMQSYLIVFSPEKVPSFPRSKKEKLVQSLTLGDNWEIERRSPNAITLDFARYSINKGKWSKFMPVIFIQEKLSPFKKGIDVTLQYPFQVDFDIKRDRELFLVMEEPEKFEIFLNLKRITYQDIGWWRDISFKKVNISNFVRFGENIIELRTKLREGKENVELESLYLIGEFGVKSLSSFLKGKGETIATQGPFVLTEAPERVQTGDLISQGFCFYAGTVSLKQIINIPASMKNISKSSKIYIEFDPPNAIGTKIQINGTIAALVAWRPYRVEVTNLMLKEKNEIVIELTNSLRNLLGPHHHIDGEPVGVGPLTFKGERDWTDLESTPERTWVNQYNFVPFGLKGKININWWKE